MVHYTAMWCTLAVDGWGCYIWYSKEAPGWAAVASSRK